MNILVVDDEAFIVDWVASILDLDTELNLNVLKAYCYSEAADLIHDQRIDILITDIKMPDGNGLDLAAGIRKQWPDCRIFLLSAYSDFDFAQRAIQNNVDGYILKTESDEYILSQVHEAIDAYENILHERQRTINIEQEMESYRQTLKSQTFFHWLQGNCITPEQMNRSMHILQLDFSQPMYLVVGRLLRIGGDLSPEECMLRAKLNAFSAIAPQVCRSVSEVYDEIVVFLLQPNKETPAFQALLEDQLEDSVHICKSVYQFSIAFATSEQVESPERISGLYWAALGRLHNTDGSEDGFIYKLSTVSAVDPVFGVRAITNLVESLERNDEKTFLDNIYAVEKQFSGSMSSQNNTFLNVYYSIAVAIMEYVSKNLSTEDLPPEIDFSNIYIPSIHKNVQNALLYLRNITQHLIRFQKESVSDNKRLLFVNIQNYIAEHAQEDISLNTLSGVFHYNGTYLSRIYTQYSGITLKKAIMQKKMERIISFMHNSQLSLNSISKLTGFSSRSYFNAFIKRNCGENPSQFRTRLLKNL